MNIDVIMKITLPSLTAQYSLLAIKFMLHNKLFVRCKPANER